MAVEHHQRAAAAPNGHVLSERPHHRGRKREGAKRISLDEPMVSAEGLIKAGVSRHIDGIGGEEMLSAMSRAESVGHASN
eukprot:6472788-Amphidinium_carterae.6